MFEFKEVATQQLPTLSLQFPIGHFFDFTYNTAEEVYKFEWTKNLICIRVYAYVCTPTCLHTELTLYYRCKDFHYSKTNVLNL